MRPRFVGRLGIADYVTATNAAVGFVAVAVATVYPFLAARLILFGAILDALDGIVARRFGGTDFGPHLDSLADVATFVMAPAFLAFAYGWRADRISLAPADLVVWFAIPAIFVVAGVVRLALYTVLDVDDAHTEGVQTTLAGTLIAVAVLVRIDPLVVLAGAVVLAALMLAPITYPDLRVRDALVMGAVQGLAVLVPRIADGLFPTVLFAWAVGYLALAPWFYRQGEGKRS